MLKGAHIDNIVFGGPGYNSQMLSKGDKIMRVDGKDVTVCSQDFDVRNDGSSCWIFITLEM